jgi:hypothetical protein
MKRTFVLGELEVELAASDPWTELVLRGRIDDRSHLDQLSGEVGGRVRIDLERVGFVTSAGVRNWLGLMRELERRGAHVELARISESMVRQMNMIVEAVGPGRVTSMFAPYRCEQCGYEGSMCLELSRHGDALRRFEAPELACPECNGTMEMLEIPERYLLLLEGQ